MNFRGKLLFTVYRLRGQAIGGYYQHYLRETLNGIPQFTVQNQLTLLLSHCQKNVPYYAKIMESIHHSFQDDPIAYLNELPILTKEIIQTRFNDLQSSDLGKRKWLVNSTGGSTGVSLQFIQDRDYYSRAGAISLLFSKLIGKELGEKEVYLWGSQHDIEGTSEGWRTRLANSISNRTFLSVYHLDDRTIRNEIQTLNQIRPKLIIAYAGAMYEFARFAEREHIKVIPQKAIMTSAGMLYPFMRKEIEKVFQCKVYNRYGCREAGDIACERPGVGGLWVAPWGNFIEVVDNDGKPVPPGVEGDLLVTSLNNFAMPFIRYHIGDRGVLAPNGSNGKNFQGQVLNNILGRTNDMFINKNHDLVDGILFLPLLAYKSWIKKYQVVQKQPDYVVIKIIKWGKEPAPDEIEWIRSKAKGIMGAECEIKIEFVDEIPSTPGGKYRYVLTEVPRPEA